MNLVFKALSDPTRRQILQLLRKNPMNAGELAEHFPIAKSTLSAHFAILREANLIEANKSGTVITYMLKVSVLEEALLANAETRGHWPAFAFVGTIEKSYGESAMINRKALWFSILLVFAMIAAAVWRLSLLPDWHHFPAEGPGNDRMIPPFVLFVPPLAVLFVMGMLYARNWLRSGTEEAVRPWQRYHGMVLVFGAGMCALAQAFNIARSLGALQSVDRLTLGHVIFVAWGIFMMVIGNMLPKMPWLTTRFRPLDPWQWNQHLRFAGKLIVVLGLFFAVGMPLLPVKTVVPVSIGLALTTMAVGFWHRSKVRRVSSPQP